MTFAEKESGEVMFTFVQSLFKSIVCVKLLSSSTDATSNMNGRYRGAVTRRERVSTFGFFRMRCMARQLDFVAQALMSGILLDIFYELMISFISFLRRQKYLFNEMGCKFRTVFSNRWNSLGSAPRWIITHRVKIVQYAAGIQHSSLSSTKWSIITEAVKSFMYSVDIRFKDIQGKRTIVSEQYAFL